MKIHQRHIKNRQNRRSRYEDIFFKKRRVRRYGKENGLSINEFCLFILFYIICKYVSFTGSGYWVHTNIVD